ncbi:MAG TPA: hypothetical protein VG317_03775 [Pseudonocardiaceae bacterium]|jgi:hypothetical protein|nr:hypothetical protein [Pseudonocardiaceae bacterium]
MATNLCPAPRCRSRSSAPGNLLCRSCRAGLAADLAGLPGRYDDCAHALSAHRSWSNDRVRGGRPAGIRLNEAAVTARARIVSVLSSWCGLVAAERRIAGPDRLEVPLLAGFLSRHLGWLAGHPAAGDLVAEITELRGAADGVREPDPTIRISLGPCPRPGCAAAVRGTMHPGRDERPTRVCCAAGHVVPPSQWLLLAHRAKPTTGP